LKASGMRRTDDAPHFQTFSFCPANDERLIMNDGDVESLASMHKQA
jgi:hypothetical protein